MKHAHLIVPRTLVAGSASGELLYAPTGLSFWGGVDPRSAEVIDRHHPLSGRHLHGRLLAIPGGPGLQRRRGIAVEFQATVGQARPGIGGEFVEAVAETGDG